MKELNHDIMTGREKGHVKNASNMALVFVHNTTWFWLMGSILLYVYQHMSIKKT